MAAAFRPRTFLAAAWGVNACINAFYIAPAPVFPEIIADLAIGKGPAGSLISLYLLAILLFQIPAGYAADRIEPRRTIALASVVLVGLSLVMALVPRYDVLLAFRFLAGVPVAFMFAPSAYLVGRAYAHAPGRGLGLFLSSAPAGVGLGNLLAPAVAAAFGWPAVLLAFNLPLLPLVPLFLRAGQGLPARDETAFGLGDYLRAFRSRELWKVGLAFAGSYAAYIFYASWSPTYLRETTDLSLLVVGVVTAGVPAAGILSRPLGGHLADGAFRGDKRRVPGLAFALLAATSLAVPALGVAGVPLLLAAGFLAQFPFSVYYLFAAQIMPRRFAGSAYAYMNTVSLMGGAVAPALAGYLADLTASFQAAFLMVAGTSLLGLLVTATVRER